MRGCWGICLIPEPTAGPLVVAQVWLHSNPSSYFQETGLYVPERHGLTFSSVSLETPVDYLPDISLGMGSLDSFRGGGLCQLVFSSR